MGYPRLQRCAKRAHDWKPMKRGGAHEQCTKCHDVFPCRSECEHLDCIVATGREIPECWGNPEEAREAMLAELAIIAPTVFYAAIAKPKPKPKRKQPAATAAPSRVRTVNGLTREQLEAQLASAIERKAWQAEDAIRAHLRMFDGGK